MKLNVKSIRTLCVYIGLTGMFWMAVMKPHTVGDFPEVIGIGVIYILTWFAHLGNQEK